MFQRQWVWLGLMFETTAFKGSWNQEEQTEEGMSGGGGGKNRKPKGWEEVFGCMMKHSSDVLPVVSSTTQHSLNQALSF